MKIQFPTKILNGVTAYAKVPSDDDPAKEYLVVKAKTLDGGVNYRCNCPGYLFRGAECHHISEFKSAWNAIVRKK